MGRKKRKANKKKRRNFNKIKSNSNKLKSSPTKSVDSNAISPHPSDLEISDSDDILSTTSSQESFLREAVYWNRNHFEEFNTNSTPIFETSADDAENFSIENKASISGLTLTSREERKVTEYDCFRTSGKSNASNSVPIARTENNESGIPSGVDSTDTSTSTSIIDKENIQFSICLTNNSAVSLTKDVIDSRNRPNFKGIDGLNCNPICINNASVTATNTKYIENPITLTGDDVESLNNFTIDSLSQDAIDCLESIVFSNANNVLESLNDIDFQCRDSTDASTSVIVIDEENQQPSVCHSNNSLVSLTHESQNGFISKGANRSNYSTVGITNGSKLSTKPDDMQEISSTNSSRKNIGFHSELNKVCSPASLLLFTTKCEYVLMLIISREIDLHKSIMEIQKFACYMLSWLEQCKSCIESKFQSRYFRRIERNACIKSIYEKKVKEFFQCSKNFEHLVKEILKFGQENCEIQLRKLIDTLKEHEEFVSNPENWPFDEYLLLHANILALTEYEKIIQLEKISNKYFIEKLPMLRNYVKQIEPIKETFFKHI